MFVGEYNMCWLAGHMLVIMTCVGEYNMRVGGYNMCW
jgi:hypothetical protein